MQKSAQMLRTQVTAKSRRDLGIFDAIIKKYSQAVTTNPDGGQNLNPQQIQPGQTIYDPTGKELVVLEADPTKTQKVLMPKDQQGKQIPEGVETLDDSAISTDYSVQNPTQTTTAQIDKAFLRGTK